MNKKEWLYIGGAVASLVGVAYLFSRGKVFFPPNTVSGAISDVDTSGGSDGSSYSPGYTNYNFGPLIPEGLGTAPEDTPAGVFGASPCCSKGCAGYSSSDTSTGNLLQFLNFMQNTDPTYLELQRTQLQSYSALFSKGEQYSNGAQVVTAVGVN